MTWDWEAWQADANARIRARDLTRAATLEEERRAEELKPTSEQLRVLVDAERRRKPRDADRIRQLGRALYDARTADHIKRFVDTCPPLSEGQITELTLLLAEPDPNPRPANPASRPVRGGRSIDPKAGSLYGGHLRATDGPCRRCDAKGRREVDHCHAHLVVRGLICRGCNGLAEASIGDDYRKNCGWCEWDIWLARELA